MHIIKPYRGRFLPAGVPTLDRNHPLAAGLACCWAASHPHQELLTESFIGPQHFPVTGITPGLSPLGSAVVATTSTNGLFWNTAVASGSATVRLLTNTGDPGAGDFTLAIIANPVASGTQGIVLGNDSTTGTTTRTNLLINTDSSGNALSGSIAFTTYDGTTLSAIAGASAIDGSYHVWVATRAGNLMTIYKDGKSIANGSPTKINITNSNCVLAIGGIPLVALGSGCSQVMAAAWNRALTSAEVAQWSADPANMLSFPDDDIFALLVGIIPIVLTSLIPRVDVNLSIIRASWEAKAARDAEQQTLQRSKLLAPPASGILVPPRVSFGVPGFAAISGAAVGPPPSYIGPGDIAVPLVGYSVRALSAAKLGQPIFTLRSAGGGTQNINALVSNGKADQASAAAFLSGNTGYLQEWIDQGPSGFNTRSLNVVDPNEFGYNPNPWPGENSQQPSYVPSAIASCPTFDPTGAIGGTGWTRGYTETQAGVAVPSSYTVFCVARPATAISAGNLCAWDVQDTSTPGSYFHVTVFTFSVRDESIDFLCRWGNVTGQMVTLDTWNGTTGTTSFAYFEATYTDGPSGDPFVKNTNTFSATATTSGPELSGYTPPYPVVIFDLNSFGPQISEILIYPALSAGVRQQIRQNIGAFYGLAVAP